MTYIPFTDLLYPEVLDPLFTYSLARPSDDGSSFSVHPLVHVWALQRQDEKQQRTNKAQAALLLSGAFSLSGDCTVHRDTPAKQMVIATIFAHVFVFLTHLSLDAIGDEDPSIISSLDNIGDECMHYALFSQAFHLRSLVVRWYEINHGWEHSTIPSESCFDNLLGVTSISESFGRYYELKESSFTPSCNAMFTPSWNVFCHALDLVTLIPLTKLQLAASAQGRLRKAISCAEQAIGGPPNGGEEAAGCDDFLEMSTFQSDKKFQMWRFFQPEKTQRSPSKKNLFGLSH